AGADVRAAGRGFLADIAALVVLPRHTALGDLGSGARDRVDGGDSRSAGAPLLGQRSLRGEFDLELTGKVLASEFLVLTDIGGDDPPKSTVGEQNAQAAAVDTGVVRDHFEVLGSLVLECPDEEFGHTHDTEAAHGDR